MYSVAVVMFIQVQSDCLPVNNLPRAENVLIIGESPSLRHNVERLGNFLCREFYIITKQPSMIDLSNKGTRLRSRTPKRGAVPLPNPKLNDSQGHWVIPSSHTFTVTELTS